MSERESDNVGSSLPAFSRAGTGGLDNLAPTRSSTDPPSHSIARHDHAPKSPHIRNRLHAQTFGGRTAHKHRNRAKETMQSAIDLKPPISFEHLLRRDKKNGDSRIAGSQNLSQQQQAVSEEHARELAAREARLRVKEEDVEKARDENEKREEELRQSLKHVEELGMSSTRQLDDTYYAILEKASLLRATVASLQQLVEEARRMKSQFEEDTREMENATSKEIEGFRGFEQQEKTINELVERLKGSKAETDRLNGRLASARQRIEACEWREREKQSKRRKRWHATWGTLVGVLVLMIAMLVIKHRKDVFDGFDAEVMANRAGHLAKEVRSNLATLVQPKPSPSEDPYLHQLFDSL